MAIQNLLNQFLGTATQSSTSGVSDMFNHVSSRMPDGFASGAATGGILALLIGSKTGRKITSKVVTYGGAALLGGLAYKAIRNWQQKDSPAQDTKNVHRAEPMAALKLTDPAESITPMFELTLIKAMIAAAKADGHIDAEEQRKIFDAIQKMELSAEMKGVVFDLLQQDISVQEIANGVTDMAQKSEIYLASFLVIEADEISERIHLVNLAQALDLPTGLTKQLEAEATQFG